MFMALYNALLIPYDVAFKPEYTDTIYFIILNLVVDL